jgi:hypothetical protein
MIDTKLLVLIVVGMASVRYIEKHKRLSGYVTADFELLLDYLAAAPSVVVIPHTLTEASNLLGQIGEPARTNIFAAFRAFILANKERFVASRRAAAAADFVRLGLTDSALLEAVTPRDMLLTEDLDLHVAALGRGRFSMRLSDLRELSSGASPPARRGSRT